MSRDSVMFATVPQPTEAVVPSVPGPKIAFPPPGAAPHAGTPPETVRTWPFDPFASELTLPLASFCRMPAVVTALSLGVLDTVVAPLSEIAPGPVENVVAPACQRFQAVW